MNSSLTKLPFLLSSVCEGRVNDVRDGIVSRSIWAIGKLKRAQSNRDANGGANVVLYKSLKNLHDY